MILEFFYKYKKIGNLKHIYIFQIVMRKKMIIEN